MRLHPEISARMKTSPYNQSPRRMRGAQCTAQPIPQSVSPAPLVQVRSAARAAGREERKNNGGKMRRRRGDMVTPKWIPVVENKRGGKGRP